MTTLDDMVNAHVAMHDNMATTARVALAAHELTKSQVPAQVPPDPIHAPDTDPTVTT